MSDDNLVKQWSARAKQAFLRGLGFASEASPAQVSAAFERALVKFKLPFLVNAVPAADYTYESRVTLPTNMQESETCFIDFPGPVIIVGLNITITGTSYGAFEDGNLPVPSLADLDVRIGVRDDELLQTGRSDPMAGGGQGAGPTGYVSAAGVVAPNRLLCLWLESPRPRLSFTFRGRYSASGSSGFPLAVRIGAAPQVIRLYPQTS